MKKRQYFNCWNCKKDFSLFIQITKEQTLTFPCVYCGSICVIDLEPYRKKIKPVMRGGEEEHDLGEALDLPKTLPTKKKPD